jgi:hypothetical protein
MHFDRQQPPQYERLVEERILVMDYTTNQAQRE